MQKGLNCLPKTFYIHSGKKLGWYC